MVIKFLKDDYNYWTKFRNSKRGTLSRKEYEMVCDLHARYKDHNYFEPCTCKPKEIKKWIEDLNTIYNNGN